MSNASRACLRLRSMISFIIRREEAIVIPRTRAIYVPIAKVANSSMKGLIARIAHSEWPEVEYRDDWPPFSFRNPKPRKQLKKHGVIVPLKKAFTSRTFRDYFKFAYVRNPWDRLVSCYAEKIAKDHGTPEGISSIFRIYGNRFWNGMKFEEFVSAVDSIPDRWADPHFRSQHIELTDLRGRVLVDEIIKLEDFGSELPSLFDRIGLSGERLGQALKSKRGEYVEYYDDDLIRKVGHRYQRDIALFDYCFGES